MIQKKHITEIRLRPLAGKDMAALCRHANEKQVVKYLERVPYPYRQKDAKKFISSSQSGRRKKTDYVFAITTYDTDELIGIVGIHDVNKTNKSSTLGYWLGKKYWGQGIMSKAVPQTISFAFQKIKLHRLSVSAFAENKASLAIIRNNGFIQEGIRRDKYFRFGRWHSIIVFGMLRQEFISQHTPPVHNAV